MKCDVYVYQKLLRSFFFYLFNENAFPKIAFHQRFSTFVVGRSKKIFIGQNIRLGGGEKGGGGKLIQLIFTVRK